MENEIQTPPPKDKNLEDIFQGLFQHSESNDEGLLRIASTFSRQFTSQQIKAIVLLTFVSNWLTEDGKKIVNEFLETWKELKQWNNSALFVMKALEYISLKKFLGENWLKVNVDK